MRLWIARHSADRICIMLFIFILSLLIAIITSAQAWACSCSQSRSMEQIVESGVIIVLASPVGKEIPGRWDNYIFPTRLKVWETYAGATNEYESVGTHPESSCSMPIPSNQTSFMVIYRDKAGLLETSICADGGFSKNQWMTYFETGKESPPRDRCYQSIKQAYSYEILLGEFKLERPECAVHIPDYNARFR